MLLKNQVLTCGLFYYTSRLQSERITSLQRQISEPSAHALGPRLIALKNVIQLVHQKARTKARSDQRLRALLCREIDPALIEHIVFLQLDEGVLTLSVKSAAWSSRLRFFGDSMLSALRHANVHATRVKMSVIAETETGGLLRSKSNHGKSLSADALSYLNEAADGMEENELKSALQRLIGNAQMKSRP